MELVVAVVTARRSYDFEFGDFMDMKDFYSMIEAVFYVPMGVA